MMSWSQRAVMSSKVIILTPADDGSWGGIPQRQHLTSRAFPEIPSIVTFRITATVLRSVLERCARLFCACHPSMRGRHGVRDETGCTHDPGTAINSKPSDCH